MSTILNSLLIPYSPVDSILVPNDLIECILPYAIPLPADYKHPALVGSLIYKDMKIPILNITGLDKGIAKPLPKNSLGKYRIVMVSSISEESFCDSYAIVASSNPSLLKVTQNIIEDANSLPSPYFYSKVKLHLENRKQLAYIPNLEQIEKELFSMELYKKIKSL